MAEREQQDPETDSGEESSESPKERPASVEKPSAGTRLSAAEIHDNVRGPAEEELDRSAFALLCSALTSGLTIGFSLIAGAFAQTMVSEKYAPLATGLVYPLGFVFVVFARSELFTENTLEPVIPVLHHRDLSTVKKMLRLWGLLLLGNLVGAFIFAYVMRHANIFDGTEIREKMLAVSRESTSDPFVLTFTRAIMAGWLIALLTWLLASTQDSTAHLALIWLTTAPIALFHFRHSIVGSVEAFYRVVAGDATLSSMVGNFIVPAVIGNAIGGVVLVAILNYGQVHQER